MVSVVIATNDRPEELGKCLESLNRQSFLPDEVIIAHAGVDRKTEGLVEKFATGNGCGMRLKYYNCGLAGSARQRNEGAERAGGDILFFVDDDIVCEPDFIKEVVAIFNRDARKEIGGISGIMTNQVYVPLRRINKLLFDLSVRKKERSANYAGKVVGPAANFLPLDAPRIEQEVDWLTSGCCAYRRDVFFKHKFNEAFLGYSFIEDVELSARVKKRVKLINTTKARCLHKDMGGKTHKNWVEIGKTQVLNRWHVMADVLGKNAPQDKIRFFYYQLYCLIAEAKMLLRWPDGKFTLLRWWGRLLGCLSLVRYGR